MHPWITYETVTLERRQQLEENERRNAQLRGDGDRAAARTRQHRLPWRTA